MAERKVFPATEETTGFSTFRRAGSFDLGVALGQNHFVTKFSGRWRISLTGDNWGELGSSVDNAAAPVSPLSSPLRPLDLRGRGIVPSSKILRHKPVKGVNSIKLACRRKYACEEHGTFSGNN